MKLTKKSGCKVNLVLNILGKRSDGFHELETVMQPIALYDEVEFSKGGTGVELTTDHPTLPCDRSNLIFRAAEGFLQEAGITDGVKIHLRKIVPMEAGMGGGSSNAAVTLLGLNEVFDSPLPSERLHQLAARLGSDVPFFLQPHPALATGRGEKIESLRSFDRLENLTMVLVHPGFGISTAWSYTTLAEFPDALNGTKGRGRRLVEALESDDPDWGTLLFNSLEAPAFHKFPVLDLYVKEFKNHGAKAALMSGSGSTVFAYFSSETEAENALEAFHSKFGNAAWSRILNA